MAVIGPDSLPVDALFAGRGPIHRLARAVDWSATPLGPTDGWPAALRGAVRLCMEALAPIAIWAGPDLTLLFNEAYAPVLGFRHREAMGRPAREVWAESWRDLGAELEHVYRT